MDDPFKQYNAQDEMAALHTLLDTLPIYATRIGFRFESTEEERKFGDAMFAVHSAWLEARP